MTDVYLCWWPEEGEGPDDAHTVPVRTDGGLWRSPEDAAIVAAEECGGGLGEHQLVYVQHKGGITVYQFRIERVDTPDYVATEVV